VTLPPWALLAIFIGIVIILCVGLVLIVRAIRGGGADETPTPEVTETTEARPTAASTPTAELGEPPTPTIVLPIESTAVPTVPTLIEQGVIVVVQGTLGAGLNLREQPSTYSKILGNAPEGTALTVTDGPSEADGYVWWQVQTPDGTIGWGAANWLVLQTDQ
jgi:hypothetical protein